MKFNFNNLPTGNLPYEDIQLCKQMMLRLYENVPFLPELPLMDPNDDIYHRTLSNIPCIKFKEGKLLIADSNHEKLAQFFIRLEKFFNSSSLCNIDEFGFKSPFFNMYIEILKRLKPKTTVISLLGPFTLANLFFNKNASVILLDKIYRKFIIYTITVKALWFISKIKEASPETQPLFLFDEQMFYKYGALKRTNENITKESIVMLLSRVFSRIRKEGALIGVQAFEKCNWQLFFDTECVDLISFDAYNNPANLNILASSVNKYLAKGGFINWGIVPVMNENAIRSLNINTIEARLKSTMEALADEGVSMDLLLKNSMVSVQGNLSKYPILFAEKAIMMANHLGEKLPVKR